MTFSFPFVLVSHSIHLLISFILPPHPCVNIFTSTLILCFHVTYLLLSPFLKASLSQWSLPSFFGIYKYSKLITQYKLTYIYAGECSVCLSLLESPHLNIIFPAPSVYQFTCKFHFLQKRRNFNVYLCHVFIAHSSVDEHIG